MIGVVELRREARRVLRKLAGNGAILARLRNGRYCILLGGKQDRAATRVDAEIVKGFYAQNWIAARGTNPESFTLSETGQAWLARSIAEGDPFAAQHRILSPRVVIDAMGLEQDVVVNEAESPLTRLAARKLIDTTQLEAGETLRRDYTLAQLAPRLGVDLTAPVVLGKRGGAAEELFSDTVLAAKQRFNHAMKAVGPGLNDLLFDVCCHLIGVEDAERGFGWPSRTGRVVLKLALDRLAMHYGLKGLGRATLRSWQME